MESITAHLPLAEEMVLLKVLNEDLFKGGLTDEPFTVDRKSRRARP